MDLVETVGEVDDFVLNEVDHLLLFVLRLYPEVLELVPLFPKLLQAVRHHVSIVFEVLGLDALADHEFLLKVHGPVEVGAAAPVEYG